MDQSAANFQGAAVLMIGFQWRDHFSLKLGEKKKRDIKKLGLLNDSLILGR